MKPFVPSALLLSLSFFAVQATAQTMGGDNQSGLEFGYSCPSGSPTAGCVGKLNQNYVAPDPTHAITVLHAKVIRLPFLIERAQPTALGSLDTDGYMSSIKSAASTALNLGATVVLDPHNFGYVYGQDITSTTGEADYLDFERKFNAWVVANFSPLQLAHLAEGLMNEPHAQSDAAYQPGFQSAINAIRAAGFPGTVTYPATGYSAIGGISVNSTFMQGVTDPKNNLVAEVHGYWDADDSGTHNTCITDSNLGHERMDGAIAWSQRTGIQLYWGETAEPEPVNQPQVFSGCYSQSDQYFRSFMQEAFTSGRFWAVTLWGDGPWWGSGYFFDLAPVNGTETADALTLQSIVAQAGVVFNTKAWYSVTNTNSTLCLDDSGAGSSNGTALIQWPCGAGKTNQEWQFTPTSDGFLTVTSRNAPLVWDVTGGPGATATSIPVQLWTGVGGTNQQWMPITTSSGAYTFRARHSGLCLDVPNASQSVVQLQQYTCNGTGAQSFTVTQQPY